VRCLNCRIASSGKVTRIADALQSGTRTLPDGDRPFQSDGALPAGIYCSVELKIPRKTPSFIIPAEALLFNRNGLQTAVVKDGKAEIRTIRVARDLGTRVEVDAGIESWRACDPQIRQSRSSMAARYSRARWHRSNHLDR